MSGSPNKPWRFLVVGSIGFATDATVFFGCVYELGWLIVSARVAASLIAMTVTWLLNRSITFADGRMERQSFEYVKYLIASLIGMSANLIVLDIASVFDRGLYHVPSYLLGAAAGLVVNYTLYDRLVFNARKVST
ncbi:MAG: GtrA family protein [Xanthobacteraceae bacterium]